MLTAPRHDSASLTASETRQKSPGSTFPLTVLNHNVALKRHDFILRFSLNTRNGLEKNYFSLDLTSMVT